MKAELVLKISMLDNIEKAEKNRDEWITAYKKIAKEYPETEDMSLLLIDRINKAFKIIKSREMLRLSDSFCGDTAFMDTVVEEEAKAEAELDGDFPLGNEFDAEFALPYFQIIDLAKIQLGLANQVNPGIYCEYAYDVLVRKGFLCELDGRWRDAQHCYCGVPTSSSVQNREDYCCHKAEEVGERLYKKGMELIKELNWGEAWYPLYKAAELEHTEAMAEIGYMTAYGLGCGRSVNEGLAYLRRAAEKGSNYACRIIWEMHDNGFYDVKAAEAKKWCEAAAKQGDKKAEARMEEGFDLRPVTEILQEQIDKGSIDALWYMAMELSSAENEEKAVEYIEMAAEKEQLDALLFYAELYGNPSNNDFYNEEKADEYYRRAAEKGSEKAILALGDRSLKDTSVPFWKQATNLEGITEKLREQHVAQFAWYLLAAEGGCVGAMPHIVTAYYYGYPVEKDQEQAFLWACRGADSGDSYAMYQVGYFYENALGCDKDMTAALMFYIQAAEAGVSDAMNRLVDIYTNGRPGIPANKEKANRYLFMSGAGRD